MPSKLFEAGFIGEDGKMRLPMDRVNAFAAAHRGRRIVAYFEVLDSDSTEAQRGYYYGYCLPAIQQAFRELGTVIPIDELDRQLVREFPGPWCDGGNDAQEARQFTKGQMSDFLDWLKLYAAENLYVYIEDSQTF